VRPKVANGRTLYTKFTVRLHAKTHKLTNTIIGARMWGFFIVLFFLSVGFKVVAVGIRSHVANTMVSNAIVRIEYGCLLTHLVQAVIKPLCIRGVCTWSKGEIAALESSGRSERVTCIVVSCVMSSTSISHPCNPYVLECRGVAQQLSVDC
jgi:hypothetical protein